MEVIVVGRVVVGAEGDPEVGTGAGMHGAEKASLVPVAVPVPDDADRPAAPEREPGDVDRIGGSMLAADAAPQSIADDVPAWVAAQALDRGHRLAENIIRQGLHIVREPKRERDCRLAGDLG